MAPKVMHRTDGDVASAAFVEFGRGKQPRDVVIALGQRPEVIRDLYHRWADLNGDVLLPVGVVREVETLLGRPFTPEDLLGELRDLMGARRQLAAFSYRCCTCGATVQAGEEEWTVILADGVLSDLECHQCEWKVAS